MSGQKGDSKITLRLGLKESEEPKDRLFKRVHKGSSMRQDKNKFGVDTISRDY